MRTLLRKLRGAFGMGLTWAVAWALIFFALGTIIGIVDPDSIDPGEEPIRIAAIGAIFGFVSGVFFAALLATGDRHKRIRDLSVTRAAVWGFLGTSLYPLLTPVGNEAVFIFGPVGAALAAGMVALARKAERAESAHDANQVGS